MADLKAEFCFNHVSRKCVGMRETRLRLFCPQKLNSSEGFILLLTKRFELSVYQKDKLGLGSFVKSEVTKAALEQKTTQCKLHQCYEILNTSCLLKAPDILDVNASARWLPRVSCLVCARLQKSTLRVRKVPFST